MGSEMQERIARAMCAASRPSSNPDDLTPAPRGRLGMIPKWRLYEHLALAAMKAMREIGPAAIDAGRNTFIPSGYYPSNAQIARAFAEALNAEINAAEEGS